MTEIKPNKTFEVNVLTQAGAIPLEVVLTNPALTAPTIHDVIEQYEQEDRLAGWTQQGQWMVFYPGGICAIAERHGSKPVLAIKPSILRASH